MVKVLRCKIAIVGDGTVGKSAFTQMVFSGGTNFPKNYLMTMGLDFVIKDIPIDEQTKVEVLLYDVAGQDLYKRSAEMHLEGIYAFICMYDITNKVSFEGCTKWVTMCRKANKSAKGVLVANKVDLKDKAEVSEAQAAIFSRTHNLLQWFEVSTLRGVNILDPIATIARDFAQCYEETLKQLLPPGSNPRSL